MTITFAATQVLDQLPIEDLAAQILANESPGVVSVVIEKDSGSEWVVCFWPKHESKL